VALGKLGGMRWPSEVEEPAVCRCARKTGFCSIRLSFQNGNGLSTFPIFELEAYDFSRRRRLLEAKPGIIDKAALAFFGRFFSRQS